MEKLRTTHRLCGITILIVLIYLSITGLMMQSIDLYQIFTTHKEPVDPDIVGNLVRQGGEFTILAPSDKNAPVLPLPSNIYASIQTVLHSVRTALGNDPLRYVEFRMNGSRLIGIVETQKVNASVDAVTGAFLQMSLVPPAPSVTRLDRLRYRIKEFHRMTIYGNWALWINVVVGLALFAMIITGTCLYVKMWSERRKQGLSGFFWVGGKRAQDDWKRAMHRAIGITAAIFLLVVAFSGEWLAYESLVFGIRMDRAMQQRRAGQGLNAPGAQDGRAANAPGRNGAGANGGRANGAGPNGQRNAPPMLQDADIPGLLQATLSATQQYTNGAPLKVIRIRAFGNVSQGVVIAGDGNDTKQYSFNAKTGQPVSGDPQAGQPGFPWGWDAHQLGKAIHRGSYFGTFARFLDLFAGLALLYLCINGLALYLDFRKDRKQFKQLVEAAC
jgi:uncharacterized iron-regulated membrane protein